MVNNFLLIESMAVFLYNLLEKNIMKTNYIDLSLMVDVLLKAAYQACQIIHNSSLKLSHVVFKSQEDPVTQIDHTIQKSITGLLESHFPGINIVGQQKIDEIMVDSQLLQSINNPSIQFDFGSHIDSQFHAKLEDLTVFIDPLDCTRGFICGKKWECTVLIGVVCKGHPVFGIIGHPYMVNHSLTKFQYHPRLIVGGTIFNQKLSYEYCGGTWEKISLKSKNNVSKTIAISSRRKNQLQEDLIQELNFNSVYCGGSGNKIAKLLRGEVDVVMFLDCPTSTWDSCAGEAIIIGMKGIFTKPDNSKIEYKFEKMDQTNYEGFICCLDQNLHKSIINCLQI